jgi:hypothetical protein
MADDTVMGRGVDAVEGSRGGKWAGRTGCGFLTTGTSTPPNDIVPVAGITRAGVLDRFPVARLDAIVDFIGVGRVDGSAAGGRGAVV